MDRRLTTRGAQRRRQLIAFATRRFAERGYHPTSVAEIVAGVGVGKGVFYWYFASKDALFLEILREAQHDLRRRQSEAIEGASTPVERIERGVRASMEWSAANRDLLTLIHFAATEEAFAPAIRKGEEVAVADAARHIRDAMSEGEVPEADAELLAHAMLGVAGHLARTYLHERRRDTAVVADAAVAFCLGGVLGPRPAARPAAGSSTRPPARSSAPAMGEPATGEPAVTAPAAGVSRAL
ncbi:MAG: TetR/AcrR family transcriptional regulator [Actinobacteria bacterium]|nr:TetR/AcrR family transcriptional regulator [Actinomycetota bacterium]